MIKVAITGNIGSGKSLVARIFQIMGLKLFNADEEAKKLYQHDDIKKRLKEIVGEAVITNGEVDKKHLAGIIFNNPTILKQINELIHPRVMANFKIWCEKQKPESIILLESAIVFESGLEKYFDYIILVSAPKPLRMQRLLQRDQTSIEQIEKRMQNQWDEAKLLPLVNAVIINDDETAVIPQVLKIVSEITKLNCEKH